MIVLVVLIYVIDDVFVIFLMFELIGLFLEVDCWVMV